MKNNLLLQSSISIGIIMIILMLKYIKYNWFYFITILAIITSVLNHGKICNKYIDRFIIFITCCIYFYYINKFENIKNITLFCLFIAILLYFISKLSKNIYYHLFAHVFGLIVFLLIYSNY